ETRVHESRAATMQAQRQEESTHTITIVGTLPAEEVAIAPSETITGATEVSSVLSATVGVTATPVPATPLRILSETATETAAVETATVQETPTVAKEDEAESTPTAQIESVNVPDSGPSITVVGTVVMTQTQTVTPTAVVIVITSEGSVDDSEDEDATPRPTIRSTQPAMTATPQPVNDAQAVSSQDVDDENFTQDILTEQMLIEQLQAEADDLTFSDLSLEFSPDGIYAAGDVELSFGLKRPIKTWANFAIENESLVVDVTTIEFNGIDVTDRFQGQVEEKVNSSLYRLLPERFVQSYELAEGEVTVLSRMR
ncbi:MAG: hypothetical protein AAF639_29320, partial [Chloroflexota bacterium]